MLVVQKYGGSSLQSTERLKYVAERIRRVRAEGHDLVVVCSAMGDTSDDLIDLAAEVSGAPPPRELDLLLSTGERAASALLAMAVDALGVPARSFSGAQAGVFTDPIHGAALIISVVPTRVEHAVAGGAVALVAGFQGVDTETGDITTLGRGGSDVTAVALAAGLGADLCEIYTDVDGVFTADPRVVPGARQLGCISYEEMLEMAAGGAKVLMTRCVEYARRHSVELHVRSAYHEGHGTFIRDTVRAHPRYPQQSSEGTVMEQPIVTGIAHTSSVARITVTGVRDSVTVAADVFGALAQAGIVVDTVLQRLGGGGRGELSFILAESDGPRAVALLDEQRTWLRLDQVLCDTGVGKVSVVGAGVRAHPAAMATFCRALAAAGIELESIATSELRISGICRAEQLHNAVRALHTGYGLDSQTRAAVYAGTGR